VSMNPIIRTRTRHYRHAYHPTRDSIINRLVDSWVDKFFIRHTDFVCYINPNGREIVIGGFEKTWKEVGVVPLKVQSHYLPGATEENSEESRR
jgi:hypothetical protein